MTNKKVLQSNFFAMVLLILYAIAPMFLIPMFNKFGMNTGLRIIVPQIGLLIVPTIVYFLITGKSVIKTLRLNAIGTKTILISITIAIITQPMAVFLSFLTQLVFPNRIGQVITQMNNMPLVIKVAIIALTPAICEEITMRGVVLSGYDNISLKKSAIMTGLFFAILHMDGNQSLYTFALGVVFAYLVRITGSIYSSMICHFTINGIQVIVSHFVTMSLGNKVVSENTGILSLPIHKIINSLIIYFILALISLKLIVILMKKLIKIHGTEGIYPKGIDSNNEKVMNLPVYVSIVMYIFIIIGELVHVYGR